MPPFPLSAVTHCLFVVNGIPACWDCGFHTRRYERNKETHAALQINNTSEDVCGKWEQPQEAMSNWRVCSGWRPLWTAGERNYKSAAANNTAVDKPHHVTLQRHTGDIEIECRVTRVHACLCVWLNNAANDGSINRVRVYGEEAGSGPFTWKGHPNSSTFQANQRGKG